jgi:hypothetical protein
MNRYPDPAILDQPVAPSMAPIPHPIGEAFVMLALLPGLVVAALIALPN